MTLRQIILVASLCARVAAAHADGPFGVSMGDSISTLPSCAPAKGSPPGVYICSSLPKSHSGFRSFMVVSSKDAGICKVGAIGTEISDSTDGIKTRNKADEIANQIASMYGNWSIKYDFIHAGALFTENHRWLMALKLKERSYIYMWNAAQTAGKNGVDKISVEADAESTSIGYITIQFQFANFARCKQAMEKEEASVF